MENIEKIKMRLTELEDTISMLNSRLIDLENNQERIFGQHISLIGNKTSVIEIITKVVAKEFGLDPFVFSNFQAYKIQIGKANNKSKIKIEDKENITQACYWLCSILHHWFFRSQSWMCSNYYWYRPYYIQRFKHIMISALENKEDKPNPIRERYYRLMKNIKDTLEEEGLYNQTYEPVFDLAEATLG